MKARAAILATLAVIGLSACDRGGGSPATSAETAAEAWVVTGDPAPDADTVAAVIRAVEAVPAPSVREGAILVGVGFDAWGGGAQPVGGRPPIPRDWYAHFPKDGGRLDDAFMARVWPD